VPPPQQNTDVTRLLGNFYKVCVSGQAARLGFTLAEVLITLGIIGVVAAITIPSLITKHQKQVTVTKLKQAYSIFSNAIKLEEVNNGYEINKSIVKNAERNEYANKYLVPNLNGVTYIQYYDEPKNCAGKVGVIGVGNQRVPCLQNGTCFWSFGHGTRTYLHYVYLYVDINGPSKPNILGRDIFTFNINLFDKGCEGYFNGCAYAINKNSTTEDLLTQCNKTSNDWGNGNGCTEIIMREGWKIPDYYPW